MKTDIRTLIRDFDMNQQSAGSGLKDGKPLTIWLPKVHKELYDQLQKQSGRRLGKMLREAVITILNEVHSAK